MAKICCIGARCGRPNNGSHCIKCSSIEVAAWNNDQHSIFESGLDDVVHQCRGKNLFFSTDGENHVNEAGIMFVPVNTVMKTRGLGADKAAD
jgi:UDPglucose 6-dehydrogenase